MTRLNARKGRSMRRSARLLLILPTLALMVGCSSSSNPGNSSSSAGSSGASASGATSASATAAAAGTIDVNIGTSTPLKWTKGQHVSIAYFAFGSFNAWLKARTAALTAAATQAGYSIHVFDGGGDVQTQDNQIQDALSSGKYNVFMITPAEGTLECNILSKQAPAKNIIVVVDTTPICGNTLASGDALRAAGTLTFVGGTSLQSNYDAWAADVVKDNPGPQKVIVLAGPPQLGPTLAIENTLKKVEAAHPDFKVESILNTQFTPQSGLSETQNALTAHPDATILMSIYTDSTEGAISAIQSAGKTGKIKVYDVGGSKYAVSQVDAGTITMTTPLLPITQGKAAVLALTNALAGKSVPPYIGGDGANYLKGLATVPAPLFIAKQNAASFTPEY